MPQIDNFEVECPQCGMKITIPYFKEVKPMIEDDMLMELSDGIHELERLMGRKLFDNA